MGCIRMVCFFMLFFFWDFIIVHVVSSLATNSWRQTPGQTKQKDNAVTLNRNTELQYLTLNPSCLYTLSHWEQTPWSCQTNQFIFIHLDFYLMDNQHVHKSILILKFSFSIAKIWVLWSGPAIKISTNKLYMLCSFCFHNLMSFVELN